MEPGFEKLDRLTRAYQFDLERDIPWDRAGEPGCYFNDAYLRKLGFDLDAVRAAPGAESLLQGLLALGTCRVFAHLETDVIVFLQDEHEDIAITRSALLLSTEEEKHTLLFNRFAALLVAHEPRLATLLDPHYAPPQTFQRLREEREKLGRVEVLHFLFWLNTVFFEELTRYVFRVLVEDADQIQPTWLAAHRCHDREETQHVLTDVAYLQRSPLTADERDRWSKVFCMHLFASYRQVLALDVVERAMGDAHPTLALFAGPQRLDALRFFEDVLQSRHFALTRGAAPYLERYRRDREARGAR